VGRGSEAPSIRPSWTDPTRVEQLTKLSYEALVKLATDGRYRWT
jgi:hypothetical protein